MAYQPNELPYGAVSSETLTGIITINLDRIYFAKTHLRQRLPDIRNRAKKFDPRN